MITRSFYTFFLILLSFTLIISISGCDGGSGILEGMPPAETPILETILDIDHNILVPYHAVGVFEMQSTKKFEIRLRAIWPSKIEVKIENQVLTNVTDDRSHPELDSSGYYRLLDEVPVGLGDPRWFVRVLVVLPADKRGNVNFAMTVHITSLNPSLSGTEKEAAPLPITVFRTGTGVPKPSSVFQCIDNKDCKHAKYDAAPNHDGAFIADDVTVAGWLINTPSPCCNPAIEDIHYEILLDNDFIERNYGPQTSPLSTAMMPGRWYTWLDDVFNPRIKIPLTGGSQPTASTFVLPGNESIIIELNAWHKPWHNNQFPPGWIMEAAPEFNGEIFWPFEVRKPFGIASSESDLQAGDYVIITGALVEDTGKLHEDEVNLNDPNDVALHWRHECWFNRYKGHGGWLEIHPVDSIRRVPAPAVRKHAQSIQICQSSNTRNWVDTYITPIPADPPSAYSELQFREIIDDRFTYMPSVGEHIVEIDPHNPTALHVKIDLKRGTGIPGNFKAVYLLWWEESNELRPTPVPWPTGRPTPNTFCFKPSAGPGVCLLAPPVYDE